MLIFNTTFHIETEIQSGFIQFIKETFIPASVKSGLLTEPRLARIFGENKDEGLSYALEFTTKDIDTLEKWNKEESAVVYAPLLDTFKDKIVGFSTVMEVME